MGTRLQVAKDPNDIDNLSWDWTNRLATGETISTFTATVVLGTWIAGVTSISGTLTTASMSGGTAGELASVRGRITTSVGRQLDWTIAVPIEEQ